MQFVTQVSFRQVENFGQLPTDKAHSLLLQAAFTKGEFLGAPDEQQFAQDFHDLGKVRAFEPFRILPKAAIPVLPGMNCFLRTGSQAVEDGLGFFCRDKMPQAHMRGITYRYHQCDVVAPDAYNIKFTGNTAYIFAVYTLYLAHALGWIYNKLICCEHVFTVCCRSGAALRCCPCADS